MRALKNRGVVVTGAAAGIGEALAQALARRGAKLLLADVNAERLHALRTTLRGQGAECSVMRVDVADRDAVLALASRAKELWGGADVVINNAGVAVFGSVESIAPADARWAVDVNFWGVWNGCQAFAAQLRAKPEAALVNVAGISALVALPAQALDAATKAAVRATSEALREELRGSSVRVLVVYPGAVASALLRHARWGDVSPIAPNREAALQQLERLATTTAAQAAEAICAAIEEGRETLAIGDDARRAGWLARLSPLRAARWLNGRLQAARSKAPAT